MELGDEAGGLTRGLSEVVGSSLASVPAVLLTGKASLGKALLGQLF